MKPAVRATVLAIASVLALAACDKGAQKPADAAAEAAKPADAADPKAAGKYPGLPTEKEQISYTIGMAMGKQLGEIKDEVNLDTVVKAMRAQLAGEKLLLTEDQGKAIFEAFGQKMQAKQIAKMMADSMKVKDSGLIKPWRAAKKLPAKPANAAPMAKALNLMTLTSSPTFALCVSGGGFPLLGDSCSRSTWFLLYRAA